MIQSVQVSRGFAAMAVAGYHVYLLFLQKFNVATDLPLRISSTRR